jgi:hypothetical protein
MEWVRALRGTAAGRRRFRGFCFGGQRRKRNWHTGPSDQRFVRARTGIMGPADSYDPTADARLLRRWLGGRRIWATGPTCQWYESDQRARVASTRHWAERQRRRVGPTVEREKGRGFGPGRGVLAHQVSLLLFFFFLFFSSYFLLNLKFKFKFNFDKPKCTSHKILAWDANVLNVFINYFINLLGHASSMIYILFFIGNSIFLSVW